MATRDNHLPPAAFTTNEEDRREVAKLQSRLQSSRKSGGGDGSGGERASSVEIAEGAHKYVLIRAALDGVEQYVVTSKHGAAYHRNAAEPMIEKLEEAGYVDIEVTGGGRIQLDSSAKSMSIFGFSYGFGKADHAISRQVVLESPIYSDFDVSISDEGY
jgi:phosphohistidine phosphatase